MSLQRSSAIRTSSPRYRWIVPLALVALAVSAPAAAAELNTAPTRFDLSPQQPGDRISEELFVKNRGEERVQVTVTTESVHRDQASVSPSSFALEGEGNRTLDIDVSLPENATGGRHDVRVRLFEGESDPGEGELTVRDATLVPVVYTVRNLAVANVRVDPGEGGDLGTETVVRNALAATVDASIHLELSGTDGVVANATLPTGRLAENETTVVRENLSVGGLTPGDYVVRGTAIHGDNRSNTWTTELQLGGENLRIVDLRVDPAAKGPSSLTAEVANSASVPLEAQVAFAVQRGSEVVEQITSTPHTVPAGESEAVTVETVLEPGEYDVRATGEWAGGDDAHAQSTVSEPEPTFMDRLPIPHGGASIFVALLAAALLARRKAGG